MRGSLTSLAPTEAPQHRRSPSAAGTPRLASLTALSCALVVLLPAAFASLAAAQPDAAASPVPQIDTQLLEQTTGLSYEIYRVRTGDTVANIAARFGITPRRIRGLNNLPPSPEPEPGRSLAIPLPRKLSPPPPQQPEAPAPRSIQPRHALVTDASPITAEPSASPTVPIFYHAQPGARLVVTAEHDHYWGVVMVDGSTGWIPKSSLKLTEQTMSPDTLQVMLQGGRPDLVQAAFRYLDTPYRYGGRLPYNVDCSLLVQTVFAARGIRLPRTAQAQCDIGHRVNYTQLLPGDRLYFTSKSGRINHTGIYIGDGRFIHASSRRGCVAIDNLSDSLYWQRFAGARRS